MEDPDRREEFVGSGIYTESSWLLQQTETQENKTNQPRIKEKCQKTNREGVDGFTSKSVFL